MIGRQIRWEYMNHCPWCGKRDFKQTFYFLASIFREEPEASTAVLCFIACILLSMVALFVQ